MSGHASVSITHDKAAQRFHADVEGGRAVAAYERSDGRMVLTHTTVPESAEGEGIGSALAREVLNYARTEQLKVVPQCRFMAAYLARHPEYEDLTG